MKNKTLFKLIESEIYPDKLANNKDKSYEKNSKDGYDFEKWSIDNYVVGIIISCIIFLIEVAIFYKIFLNLTLFFSLTNINPDLLYGISILISILYNIIAALIAIFFFKAKIDFQFFVVLPFFSFFVPLVLAILIIVSLIINRIEIIKGR